MNFSTLNQANFTSNGIGPLRSRDDDDYPVNFRLFVWGDIGSGSVSLEVFMPDDTWQSFPDLTFSGPTSQDIVLHEGAIIRVVISGATSVNVLLAS